MRRGRSLYGSRGQSKKKNNEWGLTRAREGGILYDLGEFVRGYRVRGKVGRFKLIIGGWVCLEVWGSKGGLKGG